MRDLRFGVRMIIKNPVLSVVSVLTFALGIGLTATVYSIVNAAMFDGLPFPDSDRIVVLSTTDLTEPGSRRGVPTHDYLDWRTEQTAFSHLAAVQGRTVNLVGEDGQPQRYTGAAITPNLLDLLETRPVLGRAFTEDDALPGAESVMLIGHTAWQEQFAGSRDVIGAVVRTNGTPATIIGVMPEGFAFPENEQIWVPLQISTGMARGTGPTFNVIGRLRDGVSIDAARAQISALAARIAAANPESNENVGAEVETYMDRFLGDEIPAMLYTMLGAVLGVLLIACANVANLLLARASARTREVAVRTALGASRLAVVRQLLTETLVLTTAGATLGVALSYLGVGWFRRAVSLSQPPFWMEFEIDGNVLLFVVAATVIAGLVAGLVPAIQTSRTDVGEVLKDEGRGSSSLRMSRLSGALVVAEVAVSCGLLTGAGLMIKSVVQLKSVPMPFAIDGVLTARVNLPETDYPDGPSRQRFYALLQPQLAALPGVAGAALSDGLPASGNGSLPIQIEGAAYSAPEDYPVVHEGIVTAGYFETFDVPIISGRSFTVADREETLPVAVVNETFARTFFPEGDVLGRRMRIGAGDTTNAWRTIVGVVPDLYMEGIGDNDDPPVGYYIPISQTGVGNFVSIALRGGDPATIVREVRQTIAAIDPNLPIYQVMPMADVIARETWFYGVFGTLFMVFGFAALFLAAVGLYGVMSFTVSRRKQEMGIRMALGATGNALTRMILRRGLVQLAAGLGIGMVLAILLTQPLQVVLYRVNARDPVVFGLIVVTLLTTGVLASLLPARRAARLDPVTALRPE